MDKEKLITKRNSYIELKAQCESGNYPIEIAEKVRVYEEQLKAEYDKSRENDIVKASHYIELLDELIAEAEEVIHEESVCEEMDIVDRIIAEANQE